MSDIARAFLIGRLTHDMEYKGDGKVGSFAIAVNRYAGPERGEQVSFFECALFGKTVQSLGPFLKKGRLVAVEAEPVQRSWRDVLTGQKKTAISFAVRNIQLLDRGPENGRNTQPAAAEEPPAGQVFAAQAEETPFEPPAAEAKAPREPAKKPRAGGEAAGNADIGAADNGVADDARRREAKPKEPAKRQPPEAAVEHPPFVDDLPF